MENLFRAQDYPDLLVGLSQPDDAAVWKLDNDRALVVTTDFFTPVVDDPYDFGSIAAANSLSDIYAMGGTPFMALNIAALIPDIPAEINSEILRGGAEKAREAGVVIAGGHTVQDTEPKYGLVVAGFVHPRKMMTKSGARPGDLLVLSKPLGFGALTTALKQEKTFPEEVTEVVHWMKRLNQEAGSLAADFELRGGTDVTGFGLLGHAVDMAHASRAQLRFSVDKLPFISSARKYADWGTFPGGMYDNRTYFGPTVRFHPTIPEAVQMLLFDPQTSGGLLLAVPPKKIQAFMDCAHEANQPIWVVGEVLEGQGVEVA